METAVTIGSVLGKSVFHWVSRSFRIPRRVLPLRFERRYEGIGYTYV